MLKGIWIGKFSYDQSIEELIKAFHIFNDLLGEVNYFSAMCLIELGSSHLRLKQIQNANAFLFEALEMMKKLFEVNHP